MTFNFDGIKAVKSKEAVIRANGKKEAGVIFYAVDKEGKILEGGKLFALLYDGILYMYKDVSPSLGFRLDKMGRIVVEGVNDY